MKTGREFKAVMTCAAVAVATLGMLSQSAQAYWHVTGTGNFDQPTHTTTSTATCNTPGQEQDDNDPPVQVTSTQTAAWIEDEPGETYNGGFQVQHVFKKSFLPTTTLWTGNGEGFASYEINGSTGTRTYLPNLTYTGAVTFNDSTDWKWYTHTVANNATTTTISVSPYIKSRAYATVGQNVTGSLTVTTVVKQSTERFNIPTP